ncbi:MAG: MBG domain-containing protein [bacterium]
MKQLIQLTGKDSAFLAAMFVVTVLFAFGKRAEAIAGAPTNPRDETKVPHYFGPYSNWANSPQVLADARVTITPAAGDVGTGATAVAEVDPRTGAITQVIVTSPGSGYLATPSVAITSAIATPVAAAAQATFALGVLTRVDVDEPGFGFIAPSVEIIGGNPTPGYEAKARASGGVDFLFLISGGSGYTTDPIVKFSKPDLPDGRQATGYAILDPSSMSVLAIEVVDPGSGYTSAPILDILDGVKFAATPATAVATISIDRIDVTAGGEGYLTEPMVTIRDTVGEPDKGASATASIAPLGAITSIEVTRAGSGYLTPGIKKFVDTLAGLGPAGTNNLGQYIPIAVPDTTTYPGADYYEIAVVQYRQKMHSSLPPTLLRGYVQLSTSVIPGAHVALSNASLNPGDADTPIPGYFGVDHPHYLGPAIVATKNRPVRILFRNLLPTGVSGNLFLPVDTSIMGSGAGPDMMMLDNNGVPMDMAMDEGTVMDRVRNPIAGDIPKDECCFSENRATMHLHGGVTPWISDGTAHQWITPAGEVTSYPKGVSVCNVPDMPDPGDGAQTFFYTNQQSARLMFYHDHSWGITRLNVYAGEAAPYILTDDTEKKLIADGIIPGPAYTLALIIQDKTFVSANITATDPTWDASRWGGLGSLWLPHVYMPAQNPGSITGANPFGRWMYGPWFWPPAKDAKYPPIANPYYDPNVDPSDPSIKYYEPPLIPSTPNISVGMEAFHDTPVVNGTAYPTTTVSPKAYRLKILNAGNDRMWNLQWYVADPRTGTRSEVALKPEELAAAQTDPVIAPNPDTTWSPVGPNWIQIASEGGFLPAPAVIPNQPITYITDAQRFDVGNVDKHSLLLAPAERADVIVDFSQYRGKTLILYNDAPAAFPARGPVYDYYTGGPDLTPVGAPTTLPGYGPNTRTIMQVVVANTAPDLAFDRPNTTADRFGALQAAFAHHVDTNGAPQGVFESSQDPIIVGQAAYNSAYYNSGSTNSFRAFPPMDGFARIHDFSLTFNTLLAPNGSGRTLTLPFENKGLHDEQNSASFDEWGRMSANLGLEAPNPTPNTQNIILFPFVNPSTENLRAAGMPSSLHVTPIASADDGTQIWKVTHNGVDTHPLHFHLFNVQVLNRVTWDNIIIPPDANELGWKETVRFSPLEDTIIALRPIIPTLPFGLLNSFRPLNPMMPIGARGDANSVLGTEAGFNNTDSAGNPIPPIINEIVSFGWEYMWHCHMLSHEEMDMMRPVTVAVETQLADPPVLSAATPATPGTPISLTWTDGTPVDTVAGPTWGSPKNEVGYRVKRAVINSKGVPGVYTTLETVLANSIAYTDSTTRADSSYAYLVAAYNASGESTSSVLRAQSLFPASLIRTVVQSGPWNDPATWTNSIIPAADDTVVISAGFNVTLDVNTPVIGDLTIDGSLSLGTNTLALSGNFANNGIFSPDTGTIELAGGGDQLLSATAPGTLTFYNLTLNKALKTAVVTASSTLIVTQKLRIRRGILISASDYNDIEIEKDGELRLTGDITVSGNFINNGTLTTSGHGVTFDGIGEQSLTLPSLTTFDSVIIGPSTTLVETWTGSTMVVNGTLLNHGVISTTLPITGSEKTYSSGLAMNTHDGAVEIEITDLTGSDPLTSIQVDRHDTNHPQAPGSKTTSIYWTITPTGSDFVANVTLPHAGMATPMVCRYLNGRWDWARSGYDESSVTREDLTAFGDFAVYNDPQPIVTTVTLGNTNQTYDGTARVVTATTVPSGITVDLTYNGVSGAPTNTGSYTVIGIVNETNYRGGATGILTIAKATQTINFPNLGKQVVTNKVVLSATADSAQTVNFSVGSGPAVISNAVNLSFSSAGRVTVLATQSGGSNWNAAPTATNAFDVIGVITNVAPAAGTMNGGTHVTIAGLWLGNGTDITNVTLCNISATIVTQGLHSVTVTTGVSPVVTNADVVVWSTGFGSVTLTNGFTYQPVPAPVALSAVDVTTNGFTARWKAADGATNYLIDVSGTNAFTSYAGIYNNWTIGDATACLVTGLTDGKTYFYRLRAANSYGVSTNSNTIEVPVSMNTPYIQYERTNGVASAGSSDVIDMTKLFHGSGMSYSVVTNSNPALVTPSFIGSELILKYMPGGSGSASITVRVTDSSTGFWVETTITVSVVSAPTLETGPMVFNAQIGLFEQNVTVSNTSPRVAKAVTLTVTNLPAGVTLNNATGVDEHGNSEIQWTGTLAPHSSMVFKLQYYTKTRSVTPTSSVVVSLSLEDPQTLISGTKFSINGEPVTLGKTHAFLIEFTAVPGRTYYIQYKALVTDPWKTVQPPIVAPVNRIQWIDSGPPGTESAPGSAPSRFYQVIEAVR